MEMDTHGGGDYGTSHLKKGEHHGHHHAALFRE